MTDEAQAAAMRLKAGKEFGHLVISAIIVETLVAKGAIKYEDIITRLESQLGTVEATGMLGAQKPLEQFLSLMKAAQSGDFHKPS